MMKAQYSTKLHRNILSYDDKIILWYIFYYRIPEIANYINSTNR